MSLSVWPSYLAISDDIPTTGNLIFRLWTCESEIFVRIESRIESADTIQIRIVSRIESGVVRIMSLYTYALSNK